MRKGFPSFPGLIVCLFAVSACAPTPEDIQQSRQKLYEDAYQKGDKQAVLKLGQMFEQGDGVSVNVTGARDLYMRLATEGDSDCQLRLAELYLWELKDYSNALQWLQKAAAQGNGLAETKLGYIYENGLGVVRDQTRAEEFYKKGSPDNDEVMPYFLADIKRTIENAERSFSVAHFGQFATVEFEYTEGSKATDVKIDKSSGSESLNAATIEAVKIANLPAKPRSLAGVHRFVIIVKS